MIKSSISSDIIIAGGGAAGYLTALFIKKLYSDISVILIEDPTLQPIQVGESGNVLFTNMLEFLGIDFVDWVKNTDALIKLGGNLEGWRGDCSEFFHSRISPYQNLFLDKNQSDLLYLKQLIRSDIPVWKNFLHGYSWNFKKVPMNQQKVFNWPVAMFHFDSLKNANYLKKLALARGIKIHRGKIISHRLDDSGYLKTLTLDNTATFEANWFFDCTGMSKVLLKNIYNVNYRNYSDFFLARSVITWIDDSNKNFATKIKSRKYGWQWSIDTRSRQGNGYVYSKEFIDTDAAIMEIGEDKIIVASFDWPIEYTDTISIKNVVGVGLSCGFIEPLEANGILMIMKTLNILADNWNPNLGTIDSCKINDKMNDTVTEIIEFLCFHYQCDRNDTDFWNFFKTSDYQLPFNLREKIKDLTDFIETDKSRLDFKYNDYSVESWLMIYQATKKPKVKIMTDVGILENYNSIQNFYNDLLTEADSLDFWMKKIDE